MTKTFTGDLDFLSNFYYSPITWDNITYPTAEHLFQALKTTSQEERTRIAALPTPGKAKRAGRSLTLRPDWDDLRITAMRWVVYLKFQDPDLAKRLIATGDTHLEEGNTWGDTFWGVDLSTGQGHNWLGRILMDERRELK